MRQDGCHAGDRSGGVPVDQLLVDFLGNGGLMNGQQHAAPAIGQRPGMNSCPGDGEARRFQRHAVFRQAVPAFTDLMDEPDQRMRAAEELTELLPP